MKTIIKVENVSKVYSSFKGATEYKALDEISFEIKEGEFVAIMGASGSGKTTLLNILSGIDRATSGTVIIDGENIAKLKDSKLATFRRQKIGYIFQDFNLLDSLTMRENVALPLILDGKDVSFIEKRVDEVMDYLSIKDLSAKYQFHVSGGQKQRVASARALVNNPAVCFADEPTGNLDSKSSKQTMEMLANINQEMNSTILMVTHDPYAASYCNKILFIKDGKVNFVVDRETGVTRTQFFDQILELQSALGSED